MILVPKPVVLLLVNRQICWSVLRTRERDLNALGKCNRGLGVCGGGGCAAVTTEVRAWEIRASLSPLWHCSSGFMEISTAEVSNLKMELARGYKWLSLEGPQILRASSDSSSHSCLEELIHVAVLALSSTWINKFSSLGMRVKWILHRE